MSLTTYKDIDLNHVSDTVKKYLDDNKIKEGQPAKFRLLTGVKNTDRDRAASDNTIYSSRVCIPCVDTIQDPGDANEKGEKINAGLKKIGVVKEFDNTSKQPTFKKYYIEPAKDGTFALRAHILEEVEILDALLLSNKNKSNPFRADTRENIFELINDTQEAKARSTKRKTLNACYEAIRSWKYEEMQVVAAGFNISTTQSLEVLRDALELKAEADPEVFYKAIDSEDLKIKAVIKMAKEANLIGYNAVENRWFYTGSEETLAQLDRKEGVNEIDQFAQMIKAGANGPKIRATLEKLLKKS